ncbi:MAG: lactate racemase domain-containing protein [Thermoplasmatota archaeon]
MRIKFATYRGIEGEPFEVPDDAVILEARPGEPRDEASLLRERTQGVLAPIAEGARRVLVLVDDNTRTTRAHEILPHVARELEAAGVSDEQVTIVTAQGTHRRMTPEELTSKIGAAFVSRWRVEQHDYRDRDRLVRLAPALDGMPVVVNRLMRECDVRIGVGHVGVHAIMGFSGGAKIVLPGVCGEETESWTHWTASGLAQEDLLGVLESPIRLRIEDGARIAGLDAVVNVAMDRDGHVQHVAAGDFVAAQRACARVARDWHAARLAAPVDIVITDSYPADRDYWQSSKGLYCGTIAVKEGGVIVLVTPSPEGVADNHPGCKDLCGLALEEIRRRVAAEEVDDVIGAAVAAYTARIRARSDVFLVSSGIPAEDARAMGFTPFASIQRAVDAARAKMGAHASVAILRGAGGLLPVVGGRNERILNDAPSVAGRSSA